MAIDEEGDHDHENEVEAVHVQVAPPKGHHRVETEANERPEAHGLFHTLNDAFAPLFVAGPQTPMLQCAESKEEQAPSEGH